MKTFDFSRAERIDGDEQLFVPGGRSRTIRGVATQAFAVFATFERGDAVLFDVITPGRFSVDVASHADCFVTFEPLAQAEAMVTIVRPAKATVVKGDPENMYTTISARPAVNPEMQAVLRQLRMMEAEMALLSRPMSRPARPAPVPRPSPVEQPTAQEAATTAVVDGDGA